MRQVWSAAGKWRGGQSPVKAKLGAVTRGITVGMDNIEGRAEKMTVCFTVSGRAGCPQGPVRPPRARSGAIAGRLGSHAPPGLLPLLHF